MVSGHIKCHHPILNVNSLFDILTFVHFTSYQFVLRVFDSQSFPSFLPTFIPCLLLPRITLSLSDIFVSFALTFLFLLFTSLLTNLLYGCLIPNLSQAFYSHLFPVFFSLPSHFHFLIYSSVSMSLLKNSITKKRCRCLIPNIFANICYMSSPTQHHTFPFFFVTTIICRVKFLT